MMNTSKLPGGPADSSFNHQNREYFRQVLIPFLDNASKSEVIREIREYALNWLALNDGDSILDVGCGLGHMTARFAAAVSPNGKAVGLDNSQDFVDEAKQRHANLANILILHGDASNIPLENNSLDAVYVERVFQHLPNSQLVLDEIARVLRPEGRAIIIEPDWSTLALSHPLRQATAQIIKATQDSIRNPDIVHSLPIFIEKNPLLAFTGSKVFNSHAKGCDEIDKLLPIMRAAEVGIKNGLLIEDAEKWIGKFLDFPVQMRLQFSVIFLRSCNAESQWQ